MKLVLNLFFLLLPSAASMDVPKQFIIWNVGQGLWTTLVWGNQCIHVDAGGELAPWKQIDRVCKHRTHRIFLTHGDWDHMRYAGRIKRRFQKTCLMNRPTHKLSPIKHRLLGKIKKCRNSSPWVKTIHRGASHGRPNQMSRVYLIANQIIVPGDSPTSEEKKWVKKLKGKNYLLLLGHHGSRTSTSVHLLNRLKPRVTIASARRSKYGHPHPTIVRRLKKRQIPLLDTEGWGSLHFLLE